MTRRMLRGAAVAVLPLALLLGRPAPASEAQPAPKPTLLDGGVHLVRGADDRLQVSLEIPLPERLPARRSVAVRVVPNRVAGDPAGCAEARGPALAATAGAPAGAVPGSSAMQVVLTLDRIACVGDHRLTLAVDQLEARDGGAAEVTGSTPFTVLVRLRGAPAVEPPGTEIPVLGVAACWLCWSWVPSFPLTAVLAPDLVPGRTGRELRVPLRNASLGPLSYEAKVAARGTTPAAAKDAVEIVPPGSAGRLALGGTQTVEVRLRTGADHIPAGAHDLALVVTLQPAAGGPAAIQSFPFRLNVRHPIGWSVFALALGLVLGLLLLVVREPGYAERLDLFRRIQAARDTLRGVAREPEVRAALLLQCNDLGLQVEAPGGGASGLSGRVEALELRVLALLRISALRGEPSLPAGAVTALDDAGNALIAGKDDVAQQRIDQAMNAIGGVQQRPGFAAAAAVSGDGGGSVRQLLGRWASPPLAFASRVVAPGLTVVLVLATLGFGLQQFYFAADGAATLGSKGAMDYLPLVLWGLTSVAVGNALGRLTWSK